MRNQLAAIALAALLNAGHPGVGQPHDHIVPRHMSKAGEAAVAK